MEEELQSHAENGEEMLWIFLCLLHSLLAAKPKHLHAQNQFQQLRRLSNHLLKIDWRTKTYPKWRVIVKKYSIGNNKKASAHSPFLQKSVWDKIWREITEITSSINSHVRLWKINHSSPGCSFYEFYEWYIFQ